jgi:DNA processing protein
VVVVVESRDKGGSLITARMASDYNRELFAFPGRPDDISSAGCNQLIQSSKAQLITSADDLIETMQWTTNHLKQHQTTSNNLQTSIVGLLADDLTPDQQILLAKLNEAEEGLHINLLVMETERAYSDVSSDLVSLELQGLIRSLPGGIYRLVR